MLAVEMFLTLALLRKGIPGKQWIGKYRRPRVVTWQIKRNVIKRLEQESENEYWISQPFMTKEQEQGHAAQRREWMWQQIKAAQQAKFPEHKYIADQLNHLKITQTWPS
uniref:Mitochondrial ribosomal protein L57 n=1 Tax=Sinocyclocheilus rhinocerous TaxID=307959 RepID=A0A673NEF4_9TELE